MHKLESFALSCGSKISRPTIDECFYPILEKKYICISQNSTSASKSYDYYDDVMFHLKPYLDDNKISVIELGSSGKPQIYYSKPYTHINHLHSSYVLKKCLMYVGNDNLYSHISSHYGKSVVSPYNYSYVDTEKPYWSNKGNLRIIEPPIKKRPFFIDQENPKSINLVHPEEISKEVLSSLNIEHQLDTVSTLFTGELYLDKSLDIIPGKYNPNALKIDCTPNVRMDKSFDLDFLLKCKEIKSFNIVTDQLISIDILNYLKDNINGISVFIDHQTRKEDVELIQSSGCALKLLTLESENLSELRLKFIDLNVIEYNLNFPDLPEIPNDSTIKFLSKRNIISDGSVYNSYYSLALGRNSHTIDQSKIKDFKEDIHFCRVFKETS